VGSGLHLRAHLVRDGLCRIRHRRLLPADPGLAGRHIDETALVLDALEQAIWARRRGGQGSLAGLVHHAGAGSQYTSIAVTGRLAAAGAQPSAGTVGDAYGNALAETVIGLYKAELIKPRAPWRTAGQAEVATLHYIDWFNHRRLFEACGDIPPAELEAAYHRQNVSIAEAG
jgi:putative transposase